MKLVELIDSLIYVEDPGHEYGIETRPGLDTIAELSFQKGTVSEEGRNGWQNEEVLLVLIDRMKFLNAAFPCRENSIVITKLEEALMWLQKRTADRVARGVEGKNEA